MALRKSMAILLAILLTLGFCACGTTPDTSGDIAGDTSGESIGSEAVSGDPTPPIRYIKPADILAPYPAYSFSSDAITVATDSFSPLLTKREMLSSSVSDIFTAIEEKYDTFLSVQNYPAESLLSQCEESVKNGEYFADVIAIPLKDLPKYLEKNLLLPIRLLPFVREDSAGVDREATAAIAKDGEKYALLGSGSLAELGVVTMLFNMDLLRSLGVEEDLIVKAENGEWTWDLFLTTLERAKEALPEGVSLLGTTLKREILAVAAYDSCGHFAGEAPDADAIARLDRMLACCTLSEGEAERAFRDGKLLFMIGHTDDLYDYPTAKGIWSCLPMPKAEKDAEYVCLYDPERTYVYGVLNRTVRSDHAGIYLQAAEAAAAGSCLSTLYYELLAGYIRDGSCIPMLRRTLESATVDPAYAAITAIKTDPSKAILDAVSALHPAETSEEGQG